MLDYLLSMEIANIKTATQKEIAVIIKINSAKSLVLRF